MDNSIATMTAKDYEKRLRLRELKLQTQSRNSKRSLKAKADYLKNNSKEIFSEEIVDQLSEINPVVSKIVAKVLGTPKKKSKTNLSHPMSHQRTNTNSFINILSRFSAMAAPILYTFGERKLLSYSLKGAGKLLRFSLRTLFGTKRKRRK